MTTAVVLCAPAWATVARIGPTSRPEMRHRTLTARRGGAAGVLIDLAVVAAAGLIVTGAAGCSGSSEPAGQLAVHLPGPPGRFAPARTALSNASRIDGDHLAKTASCRSCHREIAEQWEQSAHAFASFNNPVYRVSVARFRRDVGRLSSRFCAGCHDVALLVDGAMDDDIDPGDRRAHAGVTCRMCHGIAAVRPDGNGSFTLRARPIPLPRRHDRASIARHRRAASVTDLGAELCLACHRSFLGQETGNEHHLTGMDDFTPWQSSAHAGHGTGRIDDPLPPRDCIDCHMPQRASQPGKIQSTVRSHRFLGGHSWLAAMRGDRAGTTRVSQFLRGVASIDIAVAITERTAIRPASQFSVQPDQIITLPADRAPVWPGGRISFDVVVRNREVGHRFPGGVRDAQDTWIEITVRDAHGLLLAQSGLNHRSDPDDTEAHVLRAVVADQHGVVLSLRQVHRFRAPIVDHTVAPRDAVVVRYVFEVPERVVEPLAVEARLRHRTRNLALGRDACVESRSAQGRDFGRGSWRARGMILDPCQAQPITDIASTRVWIGQGQAPGPQNRISGSRPAWQRLYEHGMAWLHAVQEHLDHARPSLARALELVASGSGDTRRGQAMVMVALARLAMRQGRTDQALDWLDAAQRLGVDHAAMDAIRGAALVRVWRWQESEAPLFRAARRAAKNRQAWIDLSVALGSMGKHHAALQATGQGLRLAPRNGALLRVQALALKALGSAGATRAFAAYDRFRRPDRVTDIRFACAGRDPACARERQPVHVHLLRPPPHP
ncbi:MAG: hypothetical protein MJE77_43980 [Proteobacteria bacterium]|nr:hypothetical protein [Pseudomonadota bacterium]